MMAAVVPAVIVTLIVRGAIVNAALIVIISIAGITAVVTVIAGSVAPRCVTDAETEALGLRLCWDQRNQP